VGDAVDGTPVEGRFGPFTDNTQFATAVRRIAKARNLLHIARVSDRATRMSGKKPLLSVDVLGHPTSETLAVRDGERLQVRVENVSHSPVDIALVFIDAELGIASLFPTAGGDCRFLPGQSKVFTLGMSADRTILEHLLVLGIRADRPDLPRVPVA